jgi:hypothetical protein
MPRKTEVLADQVERARLLALLNVYDAIEAAAGKARLFYVAGEFITERASEFSLIMLAELRNQAVTLTALAPPVERAPDPASEHINRMFDALFPGLVTHTDVPGDSV